MRRVRQRAKEPSGQIAVEYKPITSLNPHPNNPRTHSNHQIRQIAKSIREFGFTNPVLIDKDGSIVAGHGRVAAAKLLEIRQVPTIRLETLSPDQVRAYILADNRLAEKAGWDETTLAIELQHLLTVPDVDITITGFEIPEIDLLLSETSEQQEGQDDVDLAIAQDVTTRPGDLWILDKHRVLCGSSIQRDSYTALMDKNSAQVVFTDPPYNVRIDGNVSGKGKVRHRDFQMASGEMDEFEFVSFLTNALRLMVRHTNRGSVHFVCMDWRHMSELLEAGRQVYESLLNLCVWVKDNGGMGSFYRSQHELIFVFRNGKERHRNNVQLGRFGRNRTNVWEYPGVNTLSKLGDEGNLQSLHPTVKPVSLVADALLDCSARGDIVLDGFLGSGSTLIAAEKTDRSCYGIELDPVYVDVAIRRWQRHTGGNAVHAGSGHPFNKTPPHRRLDGEK